MLFVINFIFLIQSKTNKSTYINEQTMKKVKDETLLLCYATDGTCSHGEVFTDISKLAELIPESTKKINLTIESDINILDLSTIPTTDATFTIIQDSMYNIYLNSIKMDENPTNIEHLILRSVKLGTGDIQLYSNKISFEQNVILFSSASKPNIIFNEQATLIADKDSFEDCFNYVSNKFPATTVNNLADSKFTLEITDSTYNLYIGYAFSPLKFSREKVPNLAFYLSRDAYSSTSSCTIKVTEQTTIESLTVKFDSAIQTGNVVFQGLTDYLNGAQKIGVDFENANGANTIDLNGFPLMKYFAFNGKYEVKNSGGSPPEQGNQICACNDDSLCDNLCGEMTKISFDSLSEKIQEIESDSISIKIVGSNDDNTFPALSLADINGKQTTIVGDGSNPKIQIECSSQYESDTNSLEISNIVVLCSSLSNNCQISNLKLLDGCTIDSSFNKVSLTVKTLECDVSQLAFKTITIQSSLALTGDASNTESTTKINFEESSTFEYMFHNSATFTGNKLVFNNLEFDLSNAIPTFSISEDSTVFNIIGNDADISTIGADINFGKPTNLNSLSISGTWSNTNPSKFFVFDDLSSDLHLHSQNIPLKVQFKSTKKIFLESEEISIIGKLSLSSEYSFSTQNYEISSSLTTNVVFNINELSIKYSNIQFSTTNINMIIKTLSIESSYPKPELNLLIDLNGQNTIEIIDKFDSLYSFSYLVTCKITEKLNDVRMKDFIDTTLTLIVVNSENTIPQPSDSNLQFDDNAPIGFNNENFQLKLSENTLVFFCSNSPLDGDIILRYGSCSYDCKGTEINDVSNLEKYISLPNSNVILIIYSSNSQPFDFDKEDISIETLTIKSSSEESKDVIAKFGNNVPILNSENIALTISDNDDFSIEKLFLLKSSSLATNTNINNIHYLFLDHNSIFTSNINQFPNDIDISIDSPSFTITYTSNGLKLTYQYSDYSTPKVYNIDASKFPKLILSIKTLDSPIIDLEDSVTELNQINSFIIYSSRIYIGSNWNQLSSSTQIKYTLNSLNDDLVVISDSFPFESWDLMYKYPISFSSKLSPYEFHDKLTFNNQKITLNTFEPVNSINYDITLDDISMSDDSSITCVSKESNNKLTIKKVHIQNGITKLNNANIKDEITIDSQSQLIEQYNLDDSLTEINLEWDLNHAPLINPSSLQNVNPQNINIIFKGSSIEGKEKEFDEFLSNGVVIIKNINPDNILPNIHFKSDSIKEFNDGENLVLKCQKINDNEIQLIAIKSLFIDPENPSESESSFEIESSSKSESFSESESSFELESSFKSESLFESENIVHNKSESFSNQESEEPSEKESENSSLSNSSSDKNKNRTIFIAVGTVLGVVVIVIIVIIIIIIKRRSNYENKKDFSQEVQSENNDMMNANIANDEITPSEFTNVLYNAKVEKEIDPFLRGFEESHI